MSIDYVHLSPAEEWLLNRIYDLGSTNLSTLVESVMPDKGWKYTTINTLLYRLHKKKLLKRKKNGGSYIYSPTVARSKRFKMFMNSMFGASLMNNPSPLVDYISSVRSFSESDQKKIRKVVESFDN